VPPAAPSHRFGGYPGAADVRTSERNVDATDQREAGSFQHEDLVGDGWTDIIRKLLLLVREDADGALARDGILRALELADFRKMEQIRAWVDASVKDPTTAAALKPYYRQFCKRPCFHDEDLDAFNRPNVTLVGTQGKGVDRITPKGVVVAGVEYELDCVIYATGFEVGTVYARRRAQRPERLLRWRLRGLLPPPARVAHRR
jgi:cyclohexanone monooxygenase